jgi:hypothetical protein
MVEEDHLLQAARIGFAVVREFQHHLGKAMRRESMRRQLVELLAGDVEFRRYMPR